MPEALILLLAALGATLAAGSWPSGASAPTTASWAAPAPVALTILPGV